MSSHMETSEDAFDIALAQYLHLSGLVFLYYDHILTFPMEVKFLWNHLGLKCRCHLFHVLKCLNSQSISISRHLKRFKADYFAEGVSCSISN
ncbi:hypothetical protein K435DRAFT_153339 [Dendrothele bispora CBS 962.96]|uniref:DUF6533 domain-containing protein n=1 Tax=Dendrothele bispora (strain CBS 962.96) TaxID=1314807 RepID=A0A4S8KM00_DENBC|nr:hypothetical protein K435DRAFT_153339 [Dendrothele bispora CBS 962.96]